MNVRSSAKSAPVDAIASPALRQQGQGWPRSINSSAHLLQQTAWPQLKRVAHDSSMQTTQSRTARAIGTGCSFCSTVPGERSYILASVSTSSRALTSESRVSCCARTKLPATSKSSLPALSDQCAAASKTEEIIEALSNACWQCSNALLPSTRHMVTRIVIPMAYPSVAALNRPRFQGSK
eukprot:5886550-Pleurochrysis_carterae.AAC.5